MNRICFWWHIKTSKTEYHDIQYVAGRPIIIDILHIWKGKHLTLTKRLNVYPQQIKFAMVVHSQNLLKSVNLILKKAKDGSSVNSVLVASQLMCQTWQNCSFTLGWKKSTTYYKCLAKFGKYWIKSKNQMCLNDQHNWLWNENLFLFIFFGCTVQTTLD